MYDYIVGFLRQDIQEEGMGKFSAELDAIMETRDVALAEVIRDTGISRASFFKYRNGSRLPSDLNTVRRIAEVLKLNYDESRRFTEAFIIISFL